MLSFNFFCSLEREDEEHYEKKTDAGHDSDDDVSDHCELGQLKTGKSEADTSHHVAKAATLRRLPQDWVIIRLISRLSNRFVLCVLLV